MAFFLKFLLKRVILAIIITVLARSKDTYGVENSVEVPDGMRFDYIIVGTSASGLVVVRSLLEKHTRKGEEINILIVDRGREYKEGEQKSEEKHAREGTKYGVRKGGKSSYSPIVDKHDISVYTSEDGHLVVESNVEGGRTSYGSTPFIPEDVYTGDYYRSLGLNFDFQRLQESFEYVKSVGDIVQPNIRTSWAIALERAFNETGTFYVGDANEEDLEPKDSLFENEMTESGYVSTLGFENDGDSQEDIMSDKAELGSGLESDLNSSNRGGTEYFTSPHYVPFTFLTYGFRRGFERRSGVRLLKINPRFAGGKTIFKILNFHVEKVIFSNLNMKDRESEKFAECIQGRRQFEGRGKRYVERGEEEKEATASHRVERYCVKPGGGRIILSAGALNTPMILQRSGVGTIEDIKVSSPELAGPIIENEYVGKGLRDHPSLSLFGFFRGIDMDSTRIPSSSALFSKRRFGSKCRKQEERDDIIQGCENISISEFEGFTDSVRDILGEKSIISKECMQLVRGVTIRIPNPYSEGEVIWDDKSKRPRVRLGLLEDINDVLILEAGFRRLVRLFRSLIVSSLLLPNVSAQKRVNWIISENSDRRLQFSSADSEITHGNFLQAQGVVPSAIYEKCGLDNLLLDYNAGHEQGDGEYKRTEVTNASHFHNKRVADGRKEEENVGDLGEGRVANVRKNLEIFERGGFGSSKETSSAGRPSYLKEIHDKLRVQEGGQSSHYGRIYRQEDGNGAIHKYDYSNYVMISRRTDPKYGLIDMISERDERANSDEPSLWKSLPFILPKLPSFPEQIRDYIRKNVRSGNEFVGTTAIGHVVETDCFRVIGTENLHILDEGILSKHTSSSPIGTSMILSRYAITKIMHNMC